MTKGEQQTPIVSTLEVLDDLRARGLITREAAFGHRTLLRQGGFQLVPVSIEELLFHLENAGNAGGGLSETAELRAIRESLLKARMSKILQIPLEIPWLSQTMNAFVGCLKRIWAESAPDTAAPRARWLLNFIDVRGWAPSTPPDNARAFALYAYGAHILHAISSPTSEMSAAAQSAYFDWLEENLLSDLEETQPEIFEWILNRVQEVIRQAADKRAGELEA